MPLSLHTAYWTNYEGGLRRRGTFIEVVKDIIDDMHVLVPRATKTCYPGW